jgi:glycosyltransferase involved in cell wall biosynthesis
MLKRKKLAILIPCYNEEKGIGKVIDTIPKTMLKRLGFTTEIIVIDNNSTDKTAEVAQARNVTLIKEFRKGKGNAILAGFNEVSYDTKYIVMLDGDNTYKSKEILRMVEPLMNNFCQVVVGSRLGGKMKKGSLRFRNRVVNLGYYFLVRQFYQANVTDVLSGYFAWKKEVINELKKHLDSEGFEIEMEMITKMHKLGFEIYSVPITYDEREGHTKIEALKDGVRILSMFFKNLTWTPDYKQTKRYKLKALLRFN